MPLDVTYTEQAKLMGIASILTIGKDAMPKSWKCYGKGKGNKRARVAAASAVARVKPYIPVKLALSREAHLKVMAVSLEATSAILASCLCADPTFPLAATLAIFRATLDSLSVVL